MRKTYIYLIVLLFITMHNINAQPCAIDIFYKYNIYVFSAQNKFSLKELYGENINPLLVNIIQVKDEESKKIIDESCLTDKMKNSMFIYPKRDKTKILRFCNQQEYINALKSNVRIKMDDE